ncbi:MAG: response regulator [Lachnospiraceae bacterium]|nr:response regulator [Lachnospiraceae bacterium]
MYKVAICEDDKDYIEYIKKIILKTNIVDESSLLFYDFYSGKQLCMSLNFDYDLVILDMQMEEMDGYETAMKMREVDRNFLLVFCSGVIQPFPLSYKANPFRYLLKEYTDDEMINEMAEVIMEMKEKKQEPFIICQTKSKEKIRVYPESVTYISKYKEYSIIHIIGKLAESHPGENLRVALKLNDVHKIFNEGCGFVRAHNSYIINMSYIVSIESHYIKLTTGEYLSFSRARSSEFKRVFAEFVAAKY